MLMNAARRKILAEQLSDSLFDIQENGRLSIERTAESLDLTTSEFKLIRSMKNDKTVRAGELAQRVQLSSSRLTRSRQSILSGSTASMRCFTGCSYLLFADSRLEIHI